MAKDSAENSTAAPPRRSDKLLTGMMVTAAAIALLSLGLITTKLMEPPPSDAFDVLQLASNQYVEGKPIVAGELAQSVTLPNTENSLPPESDDEAAETRIDPADDQQAADEAAKLEKWRTLQNFLIGAGTLKRSETAVDQRTRRQLSRLAAEKLGLSRQSGFPPGRISEGNRLYGKVLFDLGRYNEAAEPLGDAIDLDPTEARELLPIHAICLRRSIPPRPGDALVSINRFLKDPSIQLTDRWQGQEIKIETLIDLGRWPEVETEIDHALSIPPPATADDRRSLSRLQDNASLLRGVMGVRKMADQIAGSSLGSPDGSFNGSFTPNRSNPDQSLRGQANPDGTAPESSPNSPPIAPTLAEPTIEVLSAVQRQTPPETALRARLWSARARLLTGDPDNALIDFTLVRQQRPFTAVGVVAGLEESELLADQNRGVEVVQTTRYMMREIGDEDGFDSSLISLDEFRSRMMLVIEKLRIQGSYSDAIDTARALPPLLSEAEALIQEGRSYYAWAEAARSANSSNNDGTVDKVTRTRYRSAGKAFEVAAEKLFDSPEYVSTQWSAIQAYQQGRYYSHSIDLLRPYLRYEGRRRKSRGLLAMGRGLLAEGKPEQAIDYLEKCITEHPRDPLIYDARLVAAQTLAELNRDLEAIGWLRENLQDGALTPRSPAWRDSLFALGELLYRKGSELHHRYEKNGTDITPDEARTNSKILADAIARLGETSQRYWPSSQAQMATYWAARSHRLVAEEERIEASSPEILDAARRSLLSSAEGNLQSALAQFDDLANFLLTQEDDSRLDETQRRLLRNSLMARGDMMRELGRFEDAATAYRLLELRYINTPTALESIMRRSDCIRSLGRRAEADRLVQQAGLVLKRIPDDLDSQFAAITRYDRERWKQYLQWRTKRIEVQGAG